MDYALGNEPSERNGIESRAYNLATHDMLADKPPQTRFKATSQGDRIKLNQHLAGKGTPSQLVSAHEMKNYLNGNMRNDVMDYKPIGPAPGFRTEPRMSVNAPGTQKTMYMTTRP